MDFSRILLKEASDKNPTILKDTNFHLAFKTKLVSVSLYVLCIPTMLLYSFY